ncbi:MAG: hypothetical protein ACTHL3_09425 [Candidatus Nitrosocosmicus sp.]
MAGVVGPNPTRPITNLIILLAQTHDMVSEMAFTTTTTNEINIDF